MNGKFYVCRKIKLYSFLTSKGYRCLYTRPDMYNQNRIVWIFVETDDLTKSINEYYSNI